MNSVPRRFFWCAGWLVVFSSCLFASAQQGSTGATASSQIQVMSYNRTWQIGVYGSGGFAPDYSVGTLDTILYQKEQEFYTLTFEAGRMLTAAHGPGILKGRFQALGEITPYWITHSPPQKNIVHSNNPFLNGAVGEFPQYSVHGVSFTPLLLRWNFTSHNSNRHIPWLQAGGGVLWTAMRFPQGYGFPGTHTSYFNFTPQLGAGEDLFVKKNQSLNLGVRVIQYGNAGLGEINPGVPYTLNFSIGYSWWK
jgi:lipid A 3-O-deacylase